MKTTKTIKLAEFGIEINIVEGGASISSDLKEVCPYCKKIECYCPKCEAWYNSIQDSSDEIEKLVKEENRKSFNISIDALESLILAHACAGIDVEAYGYVEGIRTTLDAISTQYED